MGLTKNLGWLSKYIAADGSGNIGIATNAPDNGKLTILKNTSNATESSYGIALQSNATNAYTELLLGADDTVDCGVIQTAGKNTSFSTKKLSLQPRGGSVLIGSTSNLGPKLQIEGADDIVQIRSTDAASRSTLVFSTSGYDWEVGARGSANNPANAFYIYNNDTSSYRFIISQSGNVLVGTQTDSGDKLNVNGSIKATAFNMSGNHNASISTNSGWSAFQTLIPTGTLLGYSTYIISVWWTHNGSGQPYEVACSFLHSPVNTNGGGVDNEFTPMMSTHTGVGALMTFRSRAGYGGASGIEVKFVNFSSTTGTISVRATKMQGF